MTARAVSVLALLCAIGCSDRKASTAAASAEAVPFEHHHECAACGMLVAEQSASRAQLVHRDGTRQYFCSVGDMLAYMDAPSPHGTVVASYVESLDPEADPRVFSVEPRPWVATDSASYVLGIDKPRVMGTPVMVYDAPAAARAVAERYGGRVATWAEVRASRSAK